MPTNQAEKTLQDQLEAAVKAAPDADAPKERKERKEHSGRPENYDSEYSKQKPMLPTTTWGRLKRKVTTLAGFGEKVKIPKAPVLDIVASQDAAANGRLIQSKLTIPLGVETMQAGLTATFNEHGACKGSRLRLEPTDGSVFRCFVPTLERGAVEAYTAKAKVIEYEFAPTTDADGKPLIDPDVLNQILADHRIVNQHAALASVLGLTYAPPKKS